MKDLNEEMWDYFANLLIREMSLEYHTHVTKDTYRQINRGLSAGSLLIDVLYRLGEFTEILFEEGYTSDDE